VPALRLHAHVSRVLREGVVGRRDASRDEEGSWLAAASGAADIAYGIFMPTGPLLGVFMRGAIDSIPGSAFEHPAKVPVARWRAERWISST
jgi:hypothetical protein